MITVRISSETHCHLHCTASKSVPQRYLKSKGIEAPLIGLSYTLPDVRPDEGIYVVDTGELFAALEGESTGNKRGLERVCRLLQMDPQRLHNAGNDAHVRTTPLWFSRFLC